MDSAEKRRIFSIWAPELRLSRQNAERSWYRLLRAGVVFAAGFCRICLGPACSAVEIFPVTHNEPITVRIVDGKDGKPVALAHVVLVGGYVERDLELRQWREEALSDADGAVRLRDGLRNLPLVRVEVLKGRGCAAEGFGVSFNVDLVRREGMSGPNRCGAVAEEGAPGVLTVFVKGKKAGAKGRVDTAQNLKAVLAAGRPPTGPIEPEREKADLPTPLLSDAQAKELALAISAVLEQN